jgi:hypothetical protein
MTIAVTMAMTIPNPMIPTTVFCAVLISTFYRRGVGGGYGGL